MPMDEKYLEQAERLEQTQRDSSLQAVQRTLAGSGSANCQDCPKSIPAERRLAAPNATRCIGCQQVFEHRKGQRS